MENQNQIQPDHIIKELISCADMENFEEYLLDVHLNYFAHTDGFSDLHKQNYNFYFNSLRSLIKDVAKIQQQQNLKAA